MEKNKIKTSTGEKIFTVFNYAFFTLLCLVMLYPFCFPSAPLKHP